MPTGPLKKFVCYSGSDFTDGFNHHEINFTKINQAITSNLNLKQATIKFKINLDISSLIYHYQQCMDGKFEKTNFENMFTFTLVDAYCDEDGKAMEEWKDFIKNDIEKIEVKFEAICDYDGDEYEMTHRKGDIIHLRCWVQDESVFVGKLDGKRYNIKKSRVHLKNVKPIDDTIINQTDENQANESTSLMKTTGL